MRPTSIRYIILGMTTCVAVMLYLDRWCVGNFAQDIKNQFGLSLSETDQLQAAFFITYAFGQIPCGWLADRFGPRTMLPLFLFTWSALTGLMGLATGFGLLLFFRFGCGLFEAGAYPACAGIIRRWMPYQERGLGSAIVSLGGRIGGAIAFPLTAFLMVAFAPISSSSLFTPRDVIDPALVARMLIDPAASKPDSFTFAMAKQVRPKLSDHQLELLGDLASQGDRDQPNGTLDLIDVLNSLLVRPDLVSGIDLQKFRTRIPRDAMAEPISGASEAVVTRRNRLLVELALPDAVCKLYGWSWRPTMLVFGLAGVLLAVVFWSFFRDQPRRHFLVNEAEASLIEGADEPRTSASASPGMPTSVLWRGILTSPSLWLCALLQVGTNFSWAFLGTKLPEYLERVHQVPLFERGLMVGLAFLLSVPVTLIGGWWTDRLTRRWGGKLGRAFPMGITRFVGAGAFLTCLLLDAPWPITLAMCVMSVASDMGLPAVWAYNLDVGGRNVGLILGWGNMWGNLGAAASPYVLGRIQEHYGWNAVFVTCAAVFVVIGIAAFGIDATKPIGRSE